MFANGDPLHWRWNSSWRLLQYLIQVATFTDDVILSEVRAKNLRIVWPILADSLEIIRRCAPQNDMATNG